MPDVAIAAWVEEPEPGAPYGAKGIGEPPTITSSALGMLTPTEYADHWANYNPK